MTTPRVDSHTHIGLETFLAEPIPAEKRARPAFQDSLEATTEQLIMAMDANAVDQAITFGFPLKEIDRVRANDYVLEAARQFPRRIIPFALLGDDTEDWLKRGMRGFKQQNILYAPERFDVFRAYHIIAEAGVPVLIHFRAGPGYDVSGQVRHLLERVPRLRIIVAHMGRHTPNTSQGVESALLNLIDCPNVLFETSTVRDPRAVARAVAVVGPERVIFGSDYPFNSYLDPDPLAVEIGVVQAAGLPQDIQRKVLGENILQFLGMTEETT